ncbi:MAG: DUF6531 domain-containing protein [Candidatus Thiodiazotropha taylori]|uniref:DUF6531 domain-containing protein n=1 Tax=Candidatus Thiodiazotropha taylori TaxID=2792791 RepID=A0A9E4N550_9GAMM|nr:DUF6531 domain-containing protein [Candidatus Thiodiazotropha taylori]MCW4257079.1 DUF6531 domain-containing protein [Candidatus Thiodiazotropha taylori]
MKAPENQSKRNFLKCRKITNLSTSNVTISVIILSVNLFQVSPLQASASNDPFCWVAYPSTTSGQCYDDKAGAVSDYMSKGLPYSEMTENYSTDEEDDLFRFHYKIPDQQLEVGPWVYTVQNVNVNPLPTYESEAEAFTALREFLMEQRLSSQQHACYPVSEVVPGGDWISSRARYGVSYSELKIYEHTYWIGDYWPNPWTYVPCQSYGGSRHITRGRSVQCPLGSVQFYDANTQMCINNSRARVTQKGKYGLGVSFQCTETEANPCSPATGAKTQTETDYTLADGTLKVQRTYNSQAFEDGFTNLGPRWRHNYSQRLNGYEQPLGEDGVQAHPYPALMDSSYYDTRFDACYKGWAEIKSKVYGGILSNGVASYRSGVCEIRDGSEYVLKLPIFSTLNHTLNSGTSYGVSYVSRSNGGIEVFRNLSNQWQPLYSGKTAFEQTDAGWSYTHKDNTLETYDDSGRLVSSTRQNGQVTLFTYDDSDRLRQVIGYFGDTLTYHYDDSGNLVLINTPDGDLEYGYDDAERLISVTYPDNRTRQYHYEDPRFPYHLTGITDESTDRYATWAYDEEGRAILSEHANSTERVEFAYNADGTTTVTDAMGAQRTYHFIVKRGAPKIDHIEGDRCTTCSSGDIQSYTYDSNGFVASKTDWSGNTTTFVRDDQGRELSRTEASGTPQARTITTTWDTTINKLLTVTEPEKVTEYTYNADGQLMNRQQHAIQ